MMGVNAADRAEVVLGFARVELVQAEFVGTPQDAQVRERYRADHGALASADRAIAAPRVDDAIGQPEFEFDRATVAAGAVDGTNYGVANLFDHFEACRRRVEMPVHSKRLTVIVTADQWPGFEAVCARSDKVGTGCASTQLRMNSRKASSAGVW